MCNVSARVIISFGVSPIHIRVSHPFLRHNLLTPSSAFCGNIRFPRRSQTRHPLSTSSASSLCAITSSALRHHIRSLRHPLPAPLSSALRAIIIRSPRHYHPLSAPLSSALRAVIICSPHRYHPFSAPLSSVLRAVIIRSPRRYHLLSAPLSSALRVDVIHFCF